MNSGAFKDIEKLDSDLWEAAEEGLTDNELALFDLLFRDNLSKADRERLKQASRSLCHPFVSSCTKWTTGPKRLLHGPRSRCSF
jgi:hypothetical protein